MKGNMKYIDTSFFNITTEKIPVQSGSLLIAEPFLEESWFNRSVMKALQAWCSTIPSILLSMKFWRAFHPIAM